VERTEGGLRPARWLFLRGGFGFVWVLSAVFGGWSFGTVVFCFLVGRVVVYCCGHANRFFILVCVIWVFNG